MTSRNPRLRVVLTVIAVAILARVVPAWVMPNTIVHFMLMGFGPILGLLGVLLWWLLARGVTWRDRLLGTGAGVAAIAVSLLVSHRTMTIFLVAFALPVALGVLGAALLATRRREWSSRRFLLALSLLVVFLPCALFRMEGQVGALVPQLALRWSATAEEEFLRTRAEAEPVAAAPAEELLGTSDWPGFRGPGRDGRVEGVVFDTDWSARPPRELWRRRVGPAWSSFATAGGLAFTQEQRGEEEAVVAYSLEDGAEVWVQSTTERFEEPQAGPGPRATPTYDAGRVYTLGPGGTLQALEATRGGVVWRRSLTEDLAVAPPPWGFASSPLVVDDVVVVFAGAADGRSVAAYDRDTGEPRWSAGSGTQGYAAPVAAEIAGGTQVLMASDHGLQAFAPDSGRVLWDFPHQLPGMPRNVTPLVVDERTVIFPTGYDEGTQRLDLDGDASPREIWQSRNLKPYFNDAVCVAATCYGFDGGIFTAIGLDDGERRWKGGRFGYGQVVALPAMDALLVVTEKGEVVLLAADPGGLRELARLPALTGKTWNHPVISEGKLLVRNAEEAACFELPR